MFLRNSPCLAVCFIVVTSLTDDISFVSTADSHTIAPIVITCQENNASKYYFVVTISVFI
jgi:hypothetical protein